MVGFSMKKKDDTKKGFSGFKLNKSNNKSDSKKPSKPAFGFINDKDEEIQTTKIDTFDSNDGGFNKEEGPKRANEPLIIPNEGNSQWKTKAKQRFNPNEQNKQVFEPENKKLEYGINYINDIPKDSQEEVETKALRQDIETRAEEATLEDYEKIPVDDFGAAMLRGMGWKGEEDKESKDEEKKGKPVIPVAQRTLYLGLGAKDDGKGKDPKPIDKSYIPVKMIKKSSNRDKSPIRTKEIEYRSRE
ncbi:Pre-mRNA-splicing factor [Wickerhamomyces ciferrii]|uniref:Pre-mRNA-splicing factor n=1 Tax=Wickerhamomyces ciferrii (strain ATCC 14091 / BCRC 22168 / CBS 111 / JCM 3599 / NBRC 0793 / NRRL Y-1031 F-60-10) TaxID=1206466 RepID=K0KEX1_WICCF|nr:Pre-mRNA-splicing factor [Wickerhamomyces ciferrii]CCH43680.1 Pre-mRNA-splicing factor [Wickerhamomyces ciferrii]